MKYPPDSAQDVEALRQVLKSSQLFGSLEQEDMDSCVPYARVKTFEDEEITCECPDANHDAFVVINGAVALTFTIGSLTQTVNMIGLGTVFNTQHLLGLAQRYYGGRAVGRVVVIALDTAKLVALFESHTRLGYPVIKTLAALQLSQRDRELENFL